MVVGNMHPLAGVYAAALTPLRSDAGLDLDSVPVLLRFLASRGCHGALLFGTTGEGPSFSPAEREALMRMASSARTEMAGFRLLAGTGTPSLGESIQLTKLAFDLGFEGVVVLPPYYFRKASDDGLFNWFRELIERAVPADRYVLGYHIPDVAGIGFSIDLIARLKDAFPKQFAGIKDSSHDPDLARRLGERFGSKLVVLNGTDSYLKLAMESHAAGCITAPANLISPDLRAIWNRMVEGQDVSELQARVDDQRHLLELYPPFPATLKALIHRLHGLPRWSVRPPLVDLAPAQEDRVVEAFSKLGIAI